MIKAVAHINTHDQEGGAAKIAQVLVEAQRRSGMRTRLLVHQRKTRDEDVRLLHCAPDPMLETACNELCMPYFQFQGSFDLPWDEDVLASDVVHCHNLHFDYFNPLAISALSHAKPVVWTAHDMYPLTGFCIHPMDCLQWMDDCGDCERMYINAVKHDPRFIRAAHRKRGIADTLRLKRIIAERSHFVLAAPSEWMRGQIAKSQLSFVRAETVHNGVNLNTFQPLDRADCRRRLGIPEHALVLGGAAFGGVLTNPFKGGRYIMEVLEALWQEFPDLLFLNIGAEGASPHQGILNIPFTAREQDLAQYYSALDAYLCPSLAESFCLVAAEAMACGVPVLGFAVASLPEVVGHGEGGLLAPFGDSLSLASLVATLLRDTHTRKALGEKARARAEARFGQERMVARYQALYEELVRERARRAPATLHFQTAEVPSLFETPGFRRCEAAKGQGFSRQTTATTQLGPSIPELFRTYADTPGEAPFEDLPARIWTKWHDYGMVFVHRKAGEFDAALGLLDKLIAMFPEDAFLVRTKGVTLGLAGRFQEAEAHLRLCLDWAPPLPDTMLNLADLYRLMDNHQGSLEVLAEFRRNSPDYPGITRREGLALLALGKTRQGVRTLLREMRTQGAFDLLQPIIQGLESLGKPLLAAALRGRDEAAKAEG